MSDSSDLSIRAERRAPLPPPQLVVGVPVHPIRLDELLHWVDQTITLQGQGTIMYANAYAVLLAQRDTRFCEALYEADVVFCDGNGVRLAAELLGQPLPERFTPPDWIEHLVGQCARRSQRLFLLGAEPGVAYEAAAQLRKRFPTLQVAEHHGYFDPHGPENNLLLEHINKAAPDVLLVGMGMPRQELWVLENLPCHSVPVVIVVGALFDYLAGHMPRGPRWLTDHGFEWLCRLWYEPRRLWRRYLLGNPAFLWLVLREWWTSRFIPILPLPQPLRRYLSDDSHGDSASTSR